jgi:hypothetical protein
MVLWLKILIRKIYKKNKKRKICEVAILYIYYEEMSDRLTRQLTPTERVLSLLPANHITPMLYRILSRAPWTRTYHKIQKSKAQMFYL